MDMKKILIVPLAAILWACSARVPSTPELSKEDAAKLLAFMGLKNVVVAAVVRGTGGPNQAMVIAKWDGIQPSNEHKTFNYDKSLGWFFSEIGYKRVGLMDVQATGPVRVWTTAGYKEIVPAPANK